MEQTTQSSAEVFERLEVPFAPNDVKWLVKVVSRDRKKGRVVPYADPRAYTDRLNEIVTASGWTRRYSVHTISPVTRLKRDKTIHTGKVLVTCTVTIAGIGSHAGSGEEWADDENAMTRAEAQAFKRACSCFGLGRYFYKFGEIWVNLDERERPLQLPDLPAWALPQAHMAEPKEHAPEKQDAAPRSTASVAKGPLDASVTAKIESLRRDVGERLYANVLTMTGGVRSARDIPNKQVQQRALKWMESAARGVARIRELAPKIPEPAFYEILNDHRVRSLADVPDYGRLKQLLDRMNEIASGRTAA